jgi:hypothetical protein
MPYIGNDLQVAFPSYTSIDDISASFNGVLKTFPLRVSGSAPVPFPINPQQCLISVNNVVQKPDPTGTTGFNLVGTNIVFATAPTAGWNFFGVILAGADYVTVGTKFPAGSAAVPSITFEGDTDTGIYNVAANELGFTTGGSLKAYINSSGQYLALTGSAGSPIYSFASDTNTGIFSPGADQIGLATAGTARIQFDSNGALGLSGANYGTSGQVLTSNGSGSAPTWQNITASVTASGNNNFTGTNTFQSNTGTTFFLAAATQDGIRIRGGSGGTLSRRLDIFVDTLTQGRTIYFPNQNGDVLVSGNASIVNADISTSAGIQDTKLATITTFGKVSGTAITSGNIVTSGNIATTGTLAVGQSSAAANTELDLAGTYAQTVVAVAALNIDCSTGNYFTKTINANSTFTVSNVPSSRAYAFTLELTHTSGTVTWFSGVEWPGSVTPLLTTGKTHLFMFVTDDGGTRWRGSSLVNYTN